METKACTKCKESKPATREFFSPSRNGLGWQSWCRLCHRSLEKLRPKRVRDSAQERAYQAEYRERLREEFKSGTRLVAEGRICGGCQQYKTREHFYVESTQSTGLSKRCKLCKAASLRTPEAKAVRVATYHSEASRNDRKLVRWHKWLFDTAKQRHPKRGLSFSLPNPEFLLELWDKQGGKCYWFGVQMQPDASNKSPWQPSLERLDNTKGYEPDNVVLCSWAANRGRGEADAETWQRFCQQIRK